MGAVFASVAFGTIIPPAVSRPTSIGLYTTFPARAFQHMGPMIMGVHRRHEDAVAGAVNSGNRVPGDRTVMAPMNSNDGIRPATCGGNTLRTHSTAAAVPSQRIEGVYMAHDLLYTLQAVRTLTARQIVQKLQKACTMRNYHKVTGRPVRGRSAGIFTCLGVIFFKEIPFWTCLVIFPRTTSGFPRFMAGLFISLGLELCHHFSDHRFDEG